MAKFTPAYLKKLEDVLKEGGYEVRYEKGNFKSNYCLLEAKKVVVINKFTTLESRIQSLIEILSTLVQQGRMSTDVREVGLRIKMRNDEMNSQSELSLDLPTEAAYAALESAEEVAVISDESPAEGSSSNL